MSAGCCGPRRWLPFRVRSFRFQWPADLLTSCAFEMETLILGWYVLVETGSVLLLTLFGALLFVGTLVSPMFGVVGDRIGHRNVLCGMRAFYVVLAATLLAIALAGHLSPLLVLVITGLMGLVRPSDLGVRIALVADNMPADQLMAAMGISRTTSDSARVAGALTGAGVFALFGIGPAYVAVVCFYALGLLLTLGIANCGAARSPTRFTSGLTRPSAWRDLREGIAYVWSTPRLLAAMLLALLVNLHGLSLVERAAAVCGAGDLRLDQTALGYLVASFSFGALLGSVAVSLRENAAARAHHARCRRGLARLPARVRADARACAAASALLMLAGFAQSFCIVALTVLLLRTSHERFRGRVIGVRMLAIYSLPLGLLAAGASIERIGFSATAPRIRSSGVLVHTGDRAALACRHVAFGCVHPCQSQVQPNAERAGAETGPFTRQRSLAVAMVSVMAMAVPVSAEVETEARPIAIAAVVVAAS